MDNRYYEYKCPALMSDGRHLTNYINASVINQKIRKINKIESSDDYRAFLQKNATKNISQYGVSSTTKCRLS